MRTVYLDVENTLNAPYVTGIQRVTREFSKLVVREGGFLTKIDYVPIIFDHACQKWRRLNRKELQSLLSSKPISIDIFSRLIRKLTKLISAPQNLYLDCLESESIFLDIESSWHSRLSRADLLPALKRSGVSIVKLHYDLIPLLYPETIDPHAAKLFKQHFSAHLKYADLFLCISETSRQDVAEYCRQHGVQSPPLEVVRLGTDFHRPSAAKNNAETAEQLKAYGNYLLTVGTIEPRKNHSLLIDAFEQISTTTDLNLVIAGKVGWMSDDIIAKIKSQPDYGTRIHLLGQLSDDQIDSLYRNAWLTVIPSFYEGFGLTVAESLARGCPTICSNTGALKETGNDHVLYFSPTTPKDLTALILKLKTSSTSYQELCEKAHRYQPSVWKNMAKDLDHHLSNLFD